MGEAWEPAQLGDVLEVLHGYAFSSDAMSALSTEGPIIVSIGNFDYRGGFRFESTRMREFTAEYPKQFNLTAGDLLVAMTCQTPDGEILGLPGIIPDDGRTYLHNQRIGKVVVNPTRMNKRFAYYCFLSPHVKQQLISTASGTKILHTAPSRICEVQIRLPSIHEQQCISALLGALDDKIAVSHRIRSVAEHAGRVFFAAHFAEALQYVVTNSNLPAEWKVMTLGESASVFETGTRPRGGVSSYSTGVPSIGAESIQQLGRFDFAKAKHIPEEYFASMRRGVLRSHDILIYKDGGRPGNFEPHVSMFGNGFPFDRMCINEHVYRLRMSQPLSQWFGYFWLASEPLMNQMRIRGTGVAIPGLNSTAAKEIPVVRPPLDRLEAFDALAAPLVNKALNASREAHLLTQLRDVLLPKLMSGELRVRDAEKVVEEAT